MRIFYVLGRFTYRRRWFVVLAWVALLLVSAFFAPNLSDRLQGGGFDGADSEAEQVQDILFEEFDVSPSNLTVVFEGDGFFAESSGFQEAQNAALDEVRELDEVRDVTGYPETNDPTFISESGERSYAVISFDVPLDEAQGLVDEVRERVSNESLRTYVTGAPAVYLDITEASNEDIRQAEKYAFPLALAILVLAFGSLVAAGVPVLIGGASVAVTLSSLYFLAGVYDMSIFVLTISTMLGLGLGIDYALFAVSRFREELERRPVSEAVPRTVETAGRSIFFSGTAVLIGLMGLLFFPYMFMRSIGVAGVLVVFCSVAAALTLLPAVLAIVGHKINALPVRRRRSGGTTGTAGSGIWGQSAELVMRRAFVVLLVAGAVLFVLLYPATHMKLGVPEASVLPDRYESRLGDDVLKEDFDYARLTPIEVLATPPDDPLSAEGLAGIRDLGERVAEAEGIERVESIYTVGEEGAREYAERLAETREEAEIESSRRVDEAVEGQLQTLRRQVGSVPPGTEERVRAEAEARAARELAGQVPVLPEGISVDGSATPEGVANFLALPEVRESQEIENPVDAYIAGDRAYIRAVTESSPYTEEARDAVGEVRAIEPPAGMSLLVGGLPAGQKDFISNLYGNAPYAVAFVLGVTYLVLFFTFRSVFIPLKAVIVNILSLTASFGAMVFVFQDGNLSDLLGFTPLGFVDATLPILMFCTIFGVSMDYEVFLLSRIREAYEYGESNTASVARGLTATAGIITSAAAIIVVVTGAFAFTGIITTKAVGLGLAVAVFVDATIIRVLLVPATMRILGDWNWWPGGRKKSVFKAPGPEDVPPEARLSPPRGEGPGPEGEQRREYAPNVPRSAERRETAGGNGYLQSDGARQGEERGVGRPERWGVRPRPGRTRPDHPFLSPDRETRRAAESVSGGRAEPETGRRVSRPERQEKPRPGRAHLDGLFRLDRTAPYVAGPADGEQKTGEETGDEGTGYTRYASREEPRHEPQGPHPGK